MSDVPPAVIASLLTRILREAFEGPPGPWTYFTDTFAAAGVFGTISGLSAAEASRPAGPGRTTIAGHVNHLCSSLALTTRAIRGGPAGRDRSTSWTVSMVDGAQWTDLQARLRREYGALLVTLETHAAWDEDTLGDAIGAIAHTAYHLGAIRQRLAVQGAD
jgi:hypothetical protein